MVGRLILTNLLLIVLIDKCRVSGVGIRKYMRLLNSGCTPINIHCKLFTNIFAVHISGDSNTAHIVATYYGFHNLGPIWGLNAHYEFVHPKLKKISRRHNFLISTFLAGDNRVLWFEQQRINFNGLRFIDGHHKDYIRVSKHQTEKSSVINNEMMFNDPLFIDQWYIRGGGKYGYDMNVINAWKQGYTGNGVVVSIIDDGIQGEHPDLIHKYDTRASTDLLNGEIGYPIPHRIPFRHGTHCAGEVVSEPNNHICGVGIAFDAKIGGIRLLDSLLTDSKEARALSFNNNYIDVYSASWGPKDNGKALGGPGKLARKSLFNGVTYGRNGLGVLYVWASGNGGKNGDNCNADGYANSIYTITVSSADRFGLRPWYVEECSSIITSTFSSGANDSAIVTTDFILSPIDSGDTRQQLCTTKAGGTSASAPIAAGICALVLQANPTLSWRDVQHIIVLTSRYEPLKSEPGWKINAAGFSFNHKFGFGLMDASEMVSLARRWQNVSPLKTCKTKVYKNSRVLNIERNSKIEVNINSKNCKHHINYLEHVEAILTIKFKPRGNLEILLTSESGTMAELMKPRPKDVRANHFLNWSFTAICFWGESVSRIWNLTVINRGALETRNPGIVIDYQLVFHGF